MITGSVGAFLVLESRKRAEARGAKIYARIDAIEGDRGSREGGKLEARLERLLVPARDASETVVFSGASGYDGLTGREKDALEKALPNAAIRGFGGATGHGLEAQFPLWGAAKDARLIQEAGRSAGVDLAITEAARRHFERAMADGHGDLDMAATYLSH